MFSQRMPHVVRSVEDVINWHKKPLTKQKNKAKRR